MRRTQAARSAATKAAILDAAVARFAACGVHGSSTHDVARLAGVSRGAMLHHFPTRTDLLNGAFSHLLEGELAVLEAFSTTIRDDGSSVDRLIGFIWERYSGPLFTVTLDFLTLARTDPNVMAVVEPSAGRFNARLNDLWDQSLRSVDLPRSEKRQLMERTMLLIRGMAFQNVWRRDPAHFDGLLKTWTAELEAVFTTPTSTNAERTENDLSDRL